MKNIYISTLCAVLLLVSCSKKDDPQLLISTEAPTSEVLNKKDCSKEIKGKLTYNFTTEFDMPGSNCGEAYISTGNYSGSGQLSVLGNLTSATKACYSYIFNQTNVIGIHIENQSAYFTAPNGDILYLTNDPYDLYFNSTGYATGTCNFYFAGGTGKYENAKGSFLGYVENNLQGTFTVDVKGRLNY